MKLTVIRDMWPFWALLAIACPTGAAGASDTSPPSDDVLHVRLHNVTHGHLTKDGEKHHVQLDVLNHNSSHSVLHLNSSSADMHRDVLVSNDIVAELNLELPPANESDHSHDVWDGQESLVETEGGWASSPVNSSVAMVNREEEMTDADSSHQDTVKLTTAVIGACAAVALLAGIVGIFMSRRRRYGDAALLGEEDEEFTVFSVVDHPYPGKKGENYAALEKVPGQKNPQ